MLGQLVAAVVHELVEHGKCFVAIKAHPLVIILVSQSSQEIRELPLLWQDAIQS